MKGCFEFALRLVDLPGLTSDSTEALEIEKPYFLNRLNVPVLVVGEENVMNGRFILLAEEMQHCSQVIVIQNYAENQCRQEKTTINYQEICKALKTDKLETFFCVDFGNPHGSRHWKDQTDQGNYLDDCEVVPKVQQEMFLHEQRRAQVLQSRYGTSGNLRFGLEGVRQTLQRHSIKDLDYTLRELRKSVVLEQGRVQEDLIAKERDLRVLRNPAEWQNFLTKTAEHFRICLDDTINHNAELGETTTDQIQRLVVENPAQAATWIDEDVDNDIRSKIKEKGFLLDSKLYGLSSWSRLLDEFCGILAFAPIPVIDRDTVLHWFGRVGSGASGSSNEFDQLVEVVLMIQNQICPYYPDNRLPVMCRFLQTLRRRLVSLVRRDFDKAMQVLRSHTCGERTFVRLFLERLDADEDELLNIVSRVLQEHATTWLDIAIDGLCKPDKRRKDNVPQWLLPLKMYHFNEQPALTCIRFEPQVAAAGGNLTRQREEAPKKEYAMKFVIFVFAFPVWQMWINRKIPNKEELTKNFQSAWSTFFTPGVLAVTLATLSGSKRKAFWNRLSRPSVRSDVQHDSNGEAALSSTLTGGNAAAASNESIVEDGVLPSSRAHKVVNAKTCINLEIYEQATMKSQLHLETCRDKEIEAFRVLFALKREAADCFAAQHKGMIQQFKSFDTALSFVEKHADGRVLDPQYTEDELREVIKWLESPDHLWGNICG